MMLSGMDKRGWLALTQITIETILWAACRLMPEMGEEW